MKTNITDYAGKGVSGASYLSEIGPWVKTAAIKKIARGMARLPYRTDASHLPSKILNYASEASLKSLMNLVGIGMRKRIKTSYFQGDINAVQRDQKSEFLDNLLGVIERGFLKVSPNVRKALVNNLIVNNMETGMAKKIEFKKKYGYFPPALFVISPSMACNLECRGCYAFMYDRGKGLDNETIDDILYQAKEIGIHFITISGGEPFTRKKDMLRMAKKHHDIFFLFYTNATLIDEELAGELAEVGNITPAISVEGFREQTDARRFCKEGSVHDKVVKAMHLLREKGVFYGFSFTAVRNNHDIFLGRVKDKETGKSFIEYWMNEHGAWYGWVFNYIPIGRNPDMNLMPTPEQTDERGKFVKELRSRGYLISDFWTDGYLSGESVCLAGGRAYFHVNSKGDVEPCVFAHYTVPGNNVKEKSLVEILNSDYFRSIRERPLKNPLRPCMLIHDPQRLREDYKKFGLRDTDGEPSLVTNEEVIKGLDRWSEEYGKLADREHRRLLNIHEKKGSLLH